jgi:hypothetical protein
MDSIINEANRDHYYEAAVLNGVRLLDEKVPGWFHMINWSRLDIYSVTDCIVAQLEKRGISRSVLGFTFYWETRHFGFDVESGRVADAILLTDAWWAWEQQERPNRVRLNHNPSYSNVRMTEVQLDKV